MTTRNVPRLARQLLRMFADSRYRDCLEADLHEEFAAGRGSTWYWWQVACALDRHARSIIMRQMLPLLTATLFFLVALAAIAPATYPLMDWARSLDSLRVLVLLAWLAGVPLLLGALAAVPGPRRRGVILVAAGVAYLTPAALPFDSVVCDLCAAPRDAALPGILLLLTPLAAALLATVGARLTHCLCQSIRPGEIQ